MFEAVAKFQRVEYLVDAINEQQNFEMLEVETNDDLNRIVVPSSSTILLVSSEENSN